MTVKRHARGAGAVAMACALLAAPGAGAYELKRTTTGAPVRWDSGAVTLHTDPSVERIAPGATSAIAEAVARWSGLEGAPTLSVLPASGPSQAVDGPKLDGDSVVYFYPGGFAPAGAALAITILTYDDATGLILDADVVFNGIHAFAVLPAGAEPAPSAVPASNDGSSGSMAGSEGVFDVAHVAAHETGHALGLTDETVERSPLMYLYTLPGDAAHRSPAADDRDGLAAIYGASAQGAGCTSTVSSRSPSGATPALHLALLGILGALVAARRRRGARTPLVFAGAFAALAALPAFPSPRGAPVSERRVLAARDLDSMGLWQTELTLRSRECPSGARVTLWGGRRGTVVQEFGGVRIPRVGDAVDDAALGGAVAVCDARR